MNFRNLKTTDQKRRWFEDKLNTSLKSIGRFSVDEKKVINRNCENMIGVAQIPLGIAGPISIIQKRFNNKAKEYYLPLATTEGALVASINRGCKATKLSGGIRVLVEDVGATRGPVFKVKNIEEGRKVLNWVSKNKDILEKITEARSRFIKLKAVKGELIGKNLFLRLSFYTSEAMGMNMVTIATDSIVEVLEKKLAIKCIALSGNYCIDKKPSWLNFILGRGKKVWVESVIDKKIISQVLKTNAKQITNIVYSKNLLGSIISGSLGFNSHFANTIAAIFLATGQDMGHVVEGSLGITTAEVLENGDLYFSCYLPDLMVGTVGGGTHLETQQEALSILGLDKGKKGDSSRLAGIVGAAVLAGELSLISALASKDLSRAHQKLGRGAK